MGGTAETALSGNAIVQIVVEPNLWVNPGPITVKENLKGDYPRVIAKVSWNRPHRYHETSLKPIALTLNAATEPLTERTSALFLHPGPV